MKLRNTEALRTRPESYAIGDMLKPKHSTFLDYCGVIIGWDDWLRPLVLCITVRTGSTVPNLQVVPLDEFGMKGDVEIVHVSCPARPVFEARDSTITDEMWGRAKQFLKETKSTTVSRTCEDIARFVITGERIGQTVNDRQLAA